MEWARIDVDAYTIENRGDEDSGKVSLLVKVQIVCDVGSIRIIGPWLERRVSLHGSGVYEGVFLRGVGSKVVRRGFRVEGKTWSLIGDMELSNWGILKVQGVKSIVRWHYGRQTRNQWCEFRSIEVVDLGDFVLARDKESPEIARPTLVQRMGVSLNICHTCTELNPVY